MKKKFLAFLLLPVLFLGGCSHGAKEDASIAYSIYANEAIGSTATDSSKIVYDTTAKIIYTVDYRITTGNVQDMSSDVKKKVYDMGGYVESSTDSKTYVYAVYRVPTDSLDAFVDYVDAKEGVSEKEITTKDVSSAYSQVEARLQVINESKAYYEEYLEDNPSLSLTDKIAILNKIDELNAEKYEYENQKLKLDTKLDYSTVTIRYYSDGTYEEPSWFSEYGDYLLEFGQGFINFIMYSLPFAIVGGGIFCAIYFPVTNYRKKKAKKQ